MLISEMLGTSLTAEKMSDILYDRFGVNVYEYDTDDMSLSIDTSDFRYFCMTPTQFDEFVNRFGWYVSGYSERLVVIRKNREYVDLTKSVYAHLYIKGSQTEPSIAKKIGLRAKTYNALSDDSEDFKVGPIFSAKRNYLWDISHATSYADLASCVEDAAAYGKYIYLIKLKDRAIKDPEYELTDASACFVNRTIQPYEIIGSFTGKYANIAKEIRDCIKKIGD